MKARQRPGRAGRGGDGDPRRQTEILQQGSEVGQQFCLAAEQMRGALDVEEKTVGAVLRVPGRRGRRIARRPQRQAAQRGVVVGRFDGVHLQVARFRACIGQRLAGHKPRGFGRRVQGGDARTLAAAIDQNKRPVRINRLAGWIFRLRRQETQNRPARQPN